MADKKKNRDVANLIRLASVGSPPGLLLAALDPQFRAVARREIDLSVNAAVRSAANTIFFHAPDRLQAATEALFDQRNVPFPERYAVHLARQERLTQALGRSRPLATKVGQAGGAVAGVALVAPEYMAAKAVPRIAGAAGMTAREGAALLGGGAVANGGMQVATDVATGKRPTVKNTAGAAVGGTLGAAAVPFVGPGRAAAVAGWTTSASQDVLNGRPISAEAAGQAAIANALLGNLAGRAAATRANNLPPVAKGRLSEQLGAARSRINGEGNTTVPKKRDYYLGKPGPYWYPDRWKGPVRYEDKFGYGADLRPNQIPARDALGENFVLNHFVPEDIAAVVGLPLGFSGDFIASNAGSFLTNTADIIAENRARRAQRSERQAGPVAR